MQQAKNVHLTEIYPKLFIGSELDSCNKDLLIENDITHILNLNYPRSHEHFPNDFTYFCAEIYETAKNLVDYFEKLFEFIEGARRSNNNILIHCKSGVSRSGTTQYIPNNMLAAVCIAFLMFRNQWTLRESFVHVKRQAPEIDPNDSFLFQLLEFENILFGDSITDKFTENKTVSLIEQQTKFKQNLLRQKTTKQHGSDSEDDMTPPRMQVPTEEPIEPMQTDSDVPKLMNIILDNDTESISKQCRGYMQENKWVELGTIVASLQQNGDFLMAARKAVYQHIKELSLQMAAQVYQKKPSEFFREVLKFIDVNEVNIQKAFADESSVKRALKHGLRSLFIDHQDKAGYLLASYLHMLFISEKMHSSATGTNNSDLRSKYLDHFMIVFKYLPSYYAFMSYHEYFLSQRLLHYHQPTQTVISYEEMLLNKVASISEILQKYSQSLLQMLRDFIVSLDMCNSYTSSEMTDNTSILSVTLLQAPLWPTLTLTENWASPSFSEIEKFKPNFQIKRGVEWKDLPPKCILPPEVEKVWQQFASYFHSTSSKTLRLASHLGKAELTLHLGGKRYFLSGVPTLAMTVLCLFNDADELPFSDIQFSTNITPQLLSNTLKGLVTSNLLKKTGSVELADSDMFSFNPSFAAKTLKINFQDLLKEPKPRKQHQ